MMWSYDNKLTFELVLHETSRGGRGVKNFFLQSPVTARFEPHSGQSGQLISLVSVRVGVVGNISACHADARGSIPRHGAFFFFPGPWPSGFAAHGYNIHRVRHFARVVKGLAC